MASETPNRGELSTQADGRGAGDTTGSGRGYHVEIFLICLASLLLEISYTRIVSFKLFYYYTYLVIGLALLGIGTGSVVVSLSSRLKRASTDAIITVGSLVGAAFVFVGYVIVARLSVASLAVWDYGSRSSFDNIGNILVLCLALFASFVPIGVMISTLFARRTEGINKLYFADLVGAGVACAVVVFLLNGIGPARPIMLAGAVLAAVALRLALADKVQPTAALSGVATVWLVALTVALSLPGPLASTRCRTSAPTSTSTTRAAASPPGGAPSSGSTSTSATPCCSSTTACSGRSSRSGTATGPASAASTSTRTPDRSPSTSWASRRRRS